MSILPKLFSLPVIVLLAWMGANVYQDNDLFANPFEKQSVLEKLESSSSNFVEDKVEQASGAAKEKFKEGVDSVGNKLKDMAEKM
jgi:isopenicillin N synthase-like dioxygenase